jgi:hypothetical protein
MNFARRTIFVTKEQNAFMKKYDNVKWNAIFQKALDDTITAIANDNNNINSLPKKDEKRSYNSNESLDAMILETLEKVFYSITMNKLVEKIRLNSVIYTPDEIKKRIFVLSFIDKRIIISNDNYNKHVVKLRKRVIR